MLFEGFNLVKNRRIVGCGLLSRRRKQAPAKFRGNSNMLNKLSTLLVPFLVLATPVFGSEKSDRLVSILNYELQFQLYLDSCIDAYKEISPEDMLAENPNYFLGFNPSSPEWPQVVSIYSSYYETACNYLTAKEFASILSKNYEKHLTESEMEEAIRFYSTPVGKRLVLGHLYATEAFQRAANESASEQIRIASAEFNKQMHALARKSRQKPWWKFW